MDDISKALQEVNFARSQTVEESFGLLELIVTGLVGIGIFFFCIWKLLLLAVKTIVTIF